MRYVVLYKHPIYSGRILPSFLTEDLGFTVNPYDWCAVNKTINGKQCTIGWYIDDLKISHVTKSVVENILNRLQNKFGKEAPLTVTRGDVHVYLGITIDHTTPGQVKFVMRDIIKEILEESPEEIMTGVSSTPTTNYLFTINPDAEKLSSDKADLFHHLAAKLLYLGHRARPDLQLAISFLSTRVQSPDVDDYGKLGRCLRYLRDSKDLPLILKADNMDKVSWWVDASFAVHPDLRSHTGTTMMIGKGSLYSRSAKQKINTRSSTEGELVGVNDTMTMILWTRSFLEAQGYNVQENVVYQDNQSTLLLAKMVVNLAEKIPGTLTFDITLSPTT